MINFNIIAIDETTDDDISVKETTTTKTTETVELTIEEKPQGIFNVLCVRCISTSL